MGGKPAAKGKTRSGGQFGRVGVKSDWKADYQVAGELLAYDVMSPDKSFVVSKLAR